MNLSNFVNFSEIKKSVLMKEIPIYSGNEYRLLLLISKVKKFFFLRKFFALHEFLQSVW
jgi:hypothetical protein